MDKLTDEQLVSRYLEGEKPALEILFSRYFKRVYAFVYRYLGEKQSAEDVTQETFIKAWKHIAKYDKKRNFRTWIFTIAKNTVVDYARKKKDLVFSEIDKSKDDDELTFSESIVDPAPLPMEVLIRKDIANEAEAALKHVSAVERQLLLLRYEESFTFREIAEILKRPVNTVKSWHLRAIKKLRDKLIR